MLADRAGLQAPRTREDRQAIEKAKREREHKARLVQAFRAWEQGQVDYLSSMLRAVRGLQAKALNTGEVETAALLQGEIDEIEDRYGIFCRKDDREKFELYEEMGRG
jgi:hypothetical protein